MTLGEMTDTDKIMNPQHFDSADIKIRNWLIQKSKFESQITFKMPWWRFALTEHSIVLFVFLMCSLQQTYNTVMMYFVNIYQLRHWVTALIYINYHICYTTAACLPFCLSLFPYKRHYTLRIEHFQYDTERCMVSLRQYISSVLHTVFTV